MIDSPQQFDSITLDNPIELPRRDPEPWLLIPLSESGASVPIDVTHDFVHRRWAEIGERKMPMRIVAQSPDARSDRLSSKLA